MDWPSSRETRFRLVMPELCWIILPTLEKRWYWLTRRTKRRIITSREPVKAILLIFWCMTIACPQLGPSPRKRREKMKIEPGCLYRVWCWSLLVESQPRWLKRSTSLGNAISPDSTSLASEAQWRAVRGVCSAGLRIMTLPMKEINDIFINQARSSHRKPELVQVSMPTSKSEHLTQ